MGWQGSVQHVPLVATCESCSAPATQQCGVCVDLLLCANPACYDAAHPRAMDRDAHRSTLGPVGAVQGTLPPEANTHTVCREAGCSSALTCQHGMAGATAAQKRIRQRLASFGTRLAEQRGSAEQMLVSVRDCIAQEDSAQAQLQQELRAAYLVLHEALARQECAMEAELQRAFVAHRWGLRQDEQALVAFVAEATALLHHMEGIAQQAPGYALQLAEQKPEVLDHLASLRQPQVRVPHSMALDIPIASIVRAMQRGGVVQADVQNVPQAARGQGTTQADTGSAPLVKLKCTKVVETSLSVVAVHPTGQQFVTGNKEGVVALWETSTLTTVQSGKHKGQVLTCDVSGDGVWIASGAEDNTARVWDTRLSGSKWPWARDSSHTNLRQVHKLTAHTHKVYGVRFKPGGGPLATVSLDKTARLWDFESGQRQSHVTCDLELYTCCWCPDGRLALGSDGGGVKLWDTRSPSTTSLPREGAIWAVCPSSDGHRIVCGGMSESVVVWDVRQQQQLTSMKVGGFVHALQFMPEGDLLCGGRDKLRVYDGMSYDLLASEDQWVYSTAVCGNTILTGTDKGFARWTYEPV